MSGIKIIIAFICGFVIAQMVKLIIAALRGKKNLFEYLTKSGGMPSGHAASFTAATLSIGFYDGFTSNLFALAICMTLIVLYDATHVRYAVGEQGKALNKVIEKPLKVVEGHTFLEVCAGVLLGVVISLIIWKIF